MGHPVEQNWYFVSRPEDAGWQLGGGDCIERPSQFMLSVKYRNKKCLFNFAWLQDSATLQTSSSCRLVFNRRCFRAKISRRFFFLLRSVACIIRKMSKWVLSSCPSHDRMVKWNIATTTRRISLNLFFYMFTALCRLILTFVETGRTITNKF